MITSLVKTIRSTINRLLAWLQSCGKAMALWMPAWLSPWAWGKVEQSALIKQQEALQAGKNDSFSLDNAGESNHHEDMSCSTVVHHAIQGSEAINDDSSDSESEETCHISTKLSRGLSCKFAVSLGLAATVVGYWIARNIHVFAEVADQQAVLPSTALVLANTIEPQCVPSTALVLANTIAPQCVSSSALEVFKDVPTQAFCAAFMHDKGHVIKRVAKGLGHAVKGIGHAFQGVLQHLKEGMTPEMMAIAL